MERLKCNFHMRLRKFTKECPQPWLEAIKIKTWLELQPFC